MSISDKTSIFQYDYDRASSDCLRILNQREELEKKMENMDKELEKARRNLIVYEKISKNPHVVFLQEYDRLSGGFRQNIKQYV